MVESISKTYKKRKVKKAKKKKNNNKKIHRLGKRKEEQGIILVYGR